MKVEIVGLEKVSYDKKNGQHVEGYNINYVEPLVAPNVGLRCNREYVSNQFVPSDLACGDAELTFGRGWNGQAVINGIVMVE